MIRFIDIGSPVLSQIRKKQHKKSIVYLCGVLTKIQLPVVASFLEFVDQFPNFEFRMSSNRDLYESPLTSRYCRGSKIAKTFSERNRVSFVWKLTLIFIYEIVIFILVDRNMETVVDLAS